jgi:hypothetical protein
MKTSDESSYTYIEQITPGNTILDYKAIYATTSTTLGDPSVITGTSWEKDQNGNYKTMSYSVDLTRFGKRNEIGQISFRTITSISVGITVYGLR